MNINLLVKEIASWYKEEDKPVSISKPILSEKDLVTVNATIKDGWLSTAGPDISKFEKEISKWFNNSEVVAVSSGTAGLHLALDALNLKNGIEIITTPLTFVAPVNAIKYVNAEPIFIDISKEDLSIDIEKLRDYAKENFVNKNKKTINKNSGKCVGALLLVDVFGHLGDYSKYREFCQEYDLKFVIDSSESLGSTRNELTSVEFADIAVTSFNGNKIITTGAGGAVVTKEEELSLDIRHLASTANTASRQYSYFHDRVGYNYRMPAINAALGFSQILSLEERVIGKRKLYKKYYEKIKDLNELSIFSEPKNTTSNYWLNLFYFDELINFDEKSGFIRALNEQGVGARDVWRLVSDFPQYKEYQKTNLDNATYITSQGFNLPSTSNLELL